MSPNEWGPPTWTMFHTFIEKMKEESFSLIGPQLFSYIFRICTYLPCPECSQHAKKFLSNVNPAGLKTKDDMRNLFFVFHNIVNKRKNKHMFNLENLEKYKSIGLVASFKSFSEVYHTKGNMNLIAESFQRKMILDSFTQWLKINIIHFNL